MADQCEELRPPWEEFPTYERCSMGWRMGAGESYLDKWHQYLEHVSTDYGSRLAYLKRHRPAPVNWGDLVLSVLNPESESDEDFGCSDRERELLMNLGLIEVDVAYATWLSQQSSITWPWKLSESDTPEEIARYWTRDFWFFSRHLKAVRNSDDSPLIEVPANWEKVESALFTGECGDLDPSMGILTLSKMLCAGNIQPPWRFDLSPSSLTDSFDMDMGYCDAFLLWVISAFDDTYTLRTMFQGTDAPPDWDVWLTERTLFE